MPPSEEAAVAQLTHRNRGALVEWSTEAANFSRHLTQVLDLAQLTSQKHRLPENFGRYLLLEHIASGGMAEVFLAEMQGPLGFRRRVALKRVFPHLAGDEAFVQALVDEARMLGALVYPNIVQIVDFDFVDEVPYMAMEYVEGGHVGQLIDAARALGEPLPPELVLNLLLQVTHGLDFAHNARGPDDQPLKLIHRDLKPSNLLLNWNGQLKIADFGIAKATGNLARTLPQILKGSLPYMSPEQASGAESLDPTTDLFSLGCALYELLLLERLYNGKSPAQLLHSAIVGPDEARLERLERLPAEASPLVPIARRLLSRSPRSRYSSARELIETLEALDFPPLTAPVLTRMIARYFKPASRESKNEGRIPPTLVETLDSSGGDDTDLKLFPLGSTHEEALSVQERGAGDEPTSPTKEPTNADGERTSPKERPIGADDEMTSPTNEPAGTASELNSPSQHASTDDEWTSPSEHAGTDGEWTSLSEEPNGAARDMTTPSDMPPAPTKDSTPSTAESSALAVNGGASEQAEAMGAATRKLARDKDRLAAIPRAEESRQDSSEGKAATAARAPDDTRPTTKRPTPEANLPRNAASPVVQSISGRSRIRPALFLLPLLLLAGFLGIRALPSPSHDDSSTAAAKTLVVNILSEPEGRQVWLNGMSQGSTPIRIQLRADDRSEVVRLELALKGLDLPAQTFEKNLSSDSEWVVHFPRPPGDATVWPGSESNKRGHTEGKP